MLSGIRTFYGVHWWLDGDNDFNEVDGIDSLGKALAKARNLSMAGQGYHDFIIYAYHAQLVDDSFWEGRHFYPRHKWERVNNDFEQLWDIKGNVI